MVRKTHAGRAGGEGQDKPALPKLFSTREAADLLGIASETFLHMAKQIFSSVQLVEGGIFYWPTDEVQLYFELLLTGGFRDAAREAARRAVKQLRVKTGRLTPTQARSE